MKQLLDCYPLLVLCGGKSSRMGHPKGLLSSEGKPWLLHRLEAFSKVGGKRATVVLGYHHDRYKKSIPWLVEAQTRIVRYENLEVTVSVNPQPELGQFSSLQCGLEKIAQNPFTGVFILPVDVPFPSKEVWHQLIPHGNELPLVTVPEFQGRSGHPVLLMNAWVGHLLNVSLKDPSAARLDYQIRSLNQEQARRIAVTDERILLNINHRVMVTSAQ